MKKYHTHLIAIAISACALSLGGCLSDEVAADTAPNPSPTPSSNSAPSISGNPPAAVTVAEPYSFTPQASDPDGDPLTFSVQNQPTWADFDGTTGQLSGTPTLADIGSYTGIAISVSDGQLTTSMSAFVVDVNQVANSSTTLSWTAPTMNDDGSTLTDLTGYKLFYGRSSGNYTNEIPIDNASITTYVVENLSPDTYYFAAKAVSASGGDSAFSGEAVRAIN